MKNTKNKIDKKHFSIIGFGLAYIIIGLLVIINNFISYIHLVGGLLAIFMGLGFILWVLLNKDKKL